jgi:hypothetical protein
LLGEVRSLRVDDAVVRHRLLAGLAAALAGDVTVFEYLEIVNAFSVLTRRPGLPFAVLADRLAQALRSAPRRGTASPDLVLGVVGAIEAAGPAWRTLTPEVVVAGEETEAMDLDRFLMAAINLSFRALRRAVIVRRALLELATTNEHVDQVAFSLGYEQSNALNRDLGQVLGISPKAYRALLASSEPVPRG